MWGLRLRRFRYRSRIADTPLQRCWDSPLPSGRSDWREVSFLVVDAEMSSLELKEGELLSIGWVAVENGAILLESARHLLIKPANTVGQSATIHSLRDCDLGDARPVDAVLPVFLAAAVGKVLVFHNAALDMAYLNRESRNMFGAPLLLPLVDTLLQEEALMRKDQRVIGSGDLRLHACCERYKLPPHRGHNALLDALATAELLVAQAAHRSGGGHLALHQLL